MRRELRHGEIRYIHDAARFFEAPNGVTLYPDKLTLNPISAVCRARTRLAR